MENGKTIFAHSWKITNELFETEPLEIAKELNGMAFKKFLEDLVLFDKPWDYIRITFEAIEQRK